LKNEFEKNLERKPPNPSPRGLARPFADPTAPLPFFFLRRTLTGGAQPSGSPLPPARGSTAPPSWLSAVTGWFSHFPAFNPLLQAVVKHALHFLAITLSFPLLKPPLLMTHQGCMAIDGHGRQEPLPLPSRAYINAPMASPHRPSHTPKLLRLPLPSHARVIDWSAGHRAIAAARATLPSVKLPNPPSSLLVHIGGSLVLLFESAGPLAPPTEPAAAVFEIRPLVSIFAITASPRRFLSRPHFFVG
jgi:hypothetical protein